MGGGTGTPEIESAASRIYVAFDYPSIFHLEPQNLIRDLRLTDAGAKVGIEITAETGWTQPITTARGYGFNVFADTKLHDIGNTEVSAARTILNAKPRFLNAHATTSKNGLRKLVEMRDQVSTEQGTAGAKLLGVTILTDVEEDECFEDYRRGRKKQALHLADKVLDCGFDGVICSPQELRTLAKYARFDRMVKMVPAIRPKWSVPDDQKNFTTPTEAIEWGATHIVVGRPITAQYKAVGDTPLDAFRAIEQEVKEAA